MDMVGYSRLIGLDDAGTLSRLKALRCALIEPAIDEHGGRLVHTAGDAFLVVFDSIDGALRCALKIQHLMPSYDAEQPPERRIQFRIGIEIGDVINDGRDLHGNGVNVAARLQSKCPPGGICVSRAVREHGRAHTDLRFLNMGALSLKNIAQPTEAFLLRPGGATAHGLLVVPPTPRPTLMVLPFESPDRDLSADRLADTITDDLTTELSRFSGAVVMAQRAKTQSGAERVDFQQMCRELSVRYALRGSVRLSGAQMLINIQLADVEAGTLVHTERFGFVHADLTAIYDDFISRLVRTVRLALIGEGARRAERWATPEPDLTDLLAQGQAALMRPASRESYATAKHYFEQALTIDPESVEALTGVAGVLISNMMDGWSNSPQEDEEQAERLLNSAVARDTNSARTHIVMGLLRRLQNRLEDSQIEWETAIALDPHNPLAFCQLGLVLICMGRLDTAMANIEKSTWLTPQDPQAAISYHLRGHCHLLQSNINTAIDFVRRAHARNPGLYYNHFMLAAAFGLAGDLGKAREALVEGIRLRPELSSVEKIKQTHPWMTDRRYLKLAEPTFYLGLRKAGLPDL
jgi:TolB-like protein/tetratricopeptide (TPR) repeat protein